MEGSFAFSDSEACDRSFNLKPPLSLMVLTSGCQDFSSLSFGLRRQVGSRDLGSFLIPLITNANSNAERSAKSTDPIRNKAVTR